MIKYKIIIVSVLLICLLSIFPSYNKEIIVQEVESNNVIYLLDNDNYLLMVNVYIDSNSIEDLIIKKIELLKNGIEDITLLGTINENTVINSLKVDQDSVYIDFNKYLLETKNINKTIESIVYSLTDINGINNIYLTVDNTSIVDNPLTRKYGINKEYDIDSPNDIEQIILYFIRIKDDNKYYVPITKISNNKTDKISLIISELKSSVYSVNNLESYVSNNIELTNYEILDDKINLIFNDYILNSFKDNEILEEVKVVVSSSILENTEYKEVIFSTKDINNISSVSK